MKEKTLRSVRLVAALIGASPVVLAAAVAGIGGVPSTDALVFPAVLAGLIALPVAWRLYAALQGGAVAGEEARCRRFLVATACALAVTECAAIFGIVAFMLSRQGAALVGVATHVILAGAIWPTEARLESFLESGSGGR